jgi:hypothetical protein
MQGVPAVPAATPEQEREVLVTDELASGNIAFDGIPGVQHSHYLVRKEDEGSWTPAWELKVDRFGTEYGVPKRLPKGQIDHYLEKRRQDGGKRFTLHEPPNLLPPPRFECFIGDCRKRVQERHMLVAHIEVGHAQEAKAYGALLDTLRQAIVRDNPKLAALVSDIAATPDEPMRAVSAVVSPEVAPVAVADVTPPTEADAFVPAGHAHCGDCNWTSSKPKKNAKLSLATHRRDCPAQREE